MTRDEIREIAEIVGGDKTYKHFVHRINKEFDVSDEERNSNVYVLFEETDGEKIGFSVIGHSPAKMKVWEKTFNEEGWVGEGFRMEGSPFELMYMYVKPEYRDKGYGVNLFEKTLDFTREKKVGEVYAYISDRTQTALKFYKKMSEAFGFLPDELIEIAKKSEEMKKIDPNRAKRFLAQYRNVVRAMKKIELEKRKWVLQNKPRQFQPLGTVR